MPFVGVGMKAYIALCRRVIDQGVWVENARTGKRCLTVINADFEYDVSDGNLPVLTTKKLFWKPAIAEMLGYLRGYQNAAQFRALGCNTWNANANDNAAWLANHYRDGEDDMGRQERASVEVRADGVRRQAHPAEAGDGQVEQRSDAPELGDSTGDDRWR